MIYKGKEIKDRYKDIHFKKDIPCVNKNGTKTLMVMIKTNDVLNYELGHIEWHIMWREYILVTNHNRVLPNQYLKDIIEFLDNLNKAHKEE